MSEAWLSRHFRTWANLISSPFTSVVDRSHRVLYGSPEARALQSLYPLFDLHLDAAIMMRFANYDFTKRHRSPLPCSLGFWHADLPRLEDGLVGTAFLPGVSLPVFGKAGCRRAVNEQFDLWDALAANHPTKFRKAFGYKDVAAARRCGILSGILAIEGAHALEGDIEALPAFIERGVRYLGLSHYSANDACFPARGAGRDDSRGLTAFGRQVIEVCEAEGVIIDLTHINRKGFAEACEMSTQPVIVSHNCMHGVHPHWENVWDDQLRMVAKSGGVVGVMFQPYFLGGPSIEWVIKHLQHILNLVGEDHCSIGTDYEGASLAVPELDNAAMLPNLTDAMLFGAKWPERVIGKVLRGNVDRVLRSVPSRRDGLLAA